MNKIKLLISNLLLALTLLAPVSSVSAYSFVDGIDCKAHPEAAACHADGNDNPIIGSGGLLVKIANIVSYVAGAAAIIMIVVAAIRFMTSGGDAGRVKKARESLIYALIGVAVIVLAKTLIYFVVNIYNK